MIRESVRTGRTVEEAIDAACAQLGKGRDEVQFEILDLPKKGFLGFGAQPAKVRVYLEEPDPQPTQTQEQAPAAKSKETAASPKRETAPKKEQPVKQEAAPIPEQPVIEQTEKAEQAKPTVFSPEKAAAAQTYLAQVLGCMGVTDVKVAVREEKNNHAVLTLEGENLGVVIGRRGETLDALQYLTTLVANRVEGDYMRVTIDSGNYREKRARTLETLARKLAATVVRTGHSTTLEPMNPYERRIIHTAVATVEGASSASVGVEPNRRVVISATGAVPKQPQGQKSGGGRDGGRSGRRGDGNRARRSSGGGARGPRPERRSNDAPPAAAASGTQAAARTPKKDVEDKPLYGKIEL